MVSEPTSPQSGSESLGAGLPERGVAKPHLAGGQEFQPQDQRDPTASNDPALPLATSTDHAGHELEPTAVNAPASVQPRWMTITVALTGIIGLVVMIVLIRG